MDRIERDNITYELISDKEVKIVGVSEEMKKTTIFYTPNKLVLENKVYEVKKIEERAFYNWFELKKIYISSNILKIGDEAFILCRKLINIEVDSNNPNYSSDKGVLYDKTFTKLIYCPEGINIEDFYIPSTVNIMSGKAFAFTDIKNIILPTKRVIKNARYYNDIFYSIENKERERVKNALKISDIKVCKIQIENLFNIVDEDANIISKDAWFNKIICITNDYTIGTITDKDYLILHPDNKFKEIKEIK